MTNMTRENARQFLLAIIDAVYQTIVETPEGAPGGVLYAGLMGHGISLDQFETLMGALVMSGKVEKRGECYFAQ